MVLWPSPVNHDKTAEAPIWGLRQTSFNMQAFYWVAKDKNFTRAANRLKISPPQLSKRVSMLEEDLGVRLLHRTTRRVSLTQDGQGLLPHLEAMLDDLLDLENRFERTDKIEGTIRLTTPHFAIGFSHHSSRSSPPSTLGWSLKSNPPTS